MNGFLLGLANGATCVGYCAPVLVPWLMSGGGKVLWNVLALAGFLGGRLLGYGLFAAVAWWVKGFVTLQGLGAPWVLGVVNLALAAMLIVYGLRKPRPRCAAEGALKRLPPGSGRALWFPALLGLLTGFNFCPPFFAAAAEAVQAGSLAGCLLFFLAFFAGTSVFFVPLPFVGALSRFESARMVGGLAALLVGLYYLYRGAILVVGGLIAHGQSPH